MERATYSVAFYIKRTKTLKDGTCPIYAKITVNGKKAEFGLQKGISANDWEKFKEGKSANSNLYRQLNSYFDFVKMKLRDIRINLEERKIEVTASGLKDAFMGISRDSKTILQVFKEHNDRCKSLIGIDFAPGTYERYATCYLHIERFMDFMYSRKDMKLSELSPQFIKDFEFYLKTERKCGHNSATKYLKNFKKITRIALSNGWLKEDPFRNTKFHLDKVDLAFLTSEELNRLINTKMAMSRLEQVKDVYLFCCFTGLAFIDVKNLSYADLEEKSGRMWIKKRRQKTKNWCNIPLLPPALQLMEKYKNNPWCQKNNRVFPVLSNQKMNGHHLQN